VVADKGVDTDLDGMNDYQEIIVGTGWKDANQTFESAIDSSGAGLSITWPCNGESVYNLSRAEDIKGTFVNVQVGGQVDLIPTDQEVAQGAMTRSDPLATGPGPYYYRVVRKGNR